MKWVGHMYILRKEYSFLARKMRMRMQKPYEEGSIVHVQATVLAKVAS